MQKIHKVAIARIFTDLIKADRIVDTGEMECWRRVCEKYAITKQNETEAQGMSFADALRAICDSGVSGLKEDLLGDCRSMTVSDGFCAHSEALLMITLMLMLNPSDEFAVEAISIPRSNFNIDIATALYIENSFDSDTNEAITRDYRTVFKELQLAGFHFVYLPYIIDHYRKTDPKLFRSILSFLAPAVSDEGIEYIYKSLMQMTTGGFCKDILCNKCGIDELRDTYPSLLIKIGNSFVGETEYANYLKIEVDGDIVATVQHFVDLFSDMLSSDVFVVNTSEEKDNQFHFHGFYKQLLDIFLVRKNIRSTILIDYCKEEIAFPEIDTKVSGLHRREKALYTLLLCQGADGLNFSKPRAGTNMQKYDKRMESIIRRYNGIYGMFGGESAPDLTQSNIRGPIISILRRRIGALSGLYNPDDYNVGKNAIGAYVVNIEPELVFVKEDGKAVPLRESRLYSRFCRF